MEFTFQSDSRKTRLKSQLPLKRVAFPRFLNLSIKTLKDVCAFKLFVLFIIIWFFYMSILIFSWARWVQSTQINNSETLPDFEQQCNI